MRADKKFVIYTSLVLFVFVLSWLIIGHFGQQDYIERLKNDVQLIRTDDMGKYDYCVE